MNFEKAFEYASGELKVEELNDNPGLEVTEQASEQTAASTEGEVEAS